jgi:alkanesulfonate monooxygenase SsuD/methylene tetrahydromethanopterin reductase-like flavin-dependent oxidoreductase (luciferase family)
MRLGVAILPEHPWATGRGIWHRAEDLGFDHAWTYDHLAWRSLRDSPWYGAVPTLTAAAGVTERIRLGTLVASPNFRHPVSFVRELIALDDVSAGRFTLGIGAGAITGWDVTILGQAPWSRRERADRFAEFLELTDRLLREPEVSYDGRFYSAIEARSYPGCIQQPRLPFAVAATGPRSMGLAATYGETWVTTGDRAYGSPAPPEVGAAAVQEQMRGLDDACVAVGRDPSTLGRLVLTGPALDPGLDSVEAFRDAVGRYEDVGVTDFVVHWPRAAEPYAGDLATFERIVTA